jgi:hypothetical protein
MLAALPAGDPLSWFALHPQLLLVVVGGALWLFKRISALTPAAPGRGAEGRRPGGAGAGNAGDGAAAARPSDDDAAAAERTRRVQAEVRRKIAERRARPLAPPVVAPRPIAQPLSPPFGWPPARGVRPDAGEAAEMASGERSEAPPTNGGEPWRSPAFPSDGDRGAVSARATLRPTAPAAGSVRPSAQFESGPAFTGGSAQAANPPNVRELTADVVARNARNFAAATAASAAMPAPSVGTALAAELREPATVRRAMLLREILGPPVALR